MSFNSASMVDIRRLFGAVNTLASVSGGCAAALPDLHVTTDAAGHQWFRAKLLPRGDVQVWDVPAGMVGGAGNRDSPAGLVDHFSGSHEFATANGFVGAFPTIRQVDNGAGRHCGTVLITAGRAEHRDVPAGHLLGPGRVFHARATVDGIGQRLRAVSGYATANGFGGGLPTFHERQGPDGETRHGVVLLPRDLARHRDVPAADLGILDHMSDYVFAPGISREEQRQILAQHYRGWQRFGDCRS